MAYDEAFRIGWSFFWRRALWIGALVAFPVGLLIYVDGWPVRYPALVVLALLAPIEILAINPRVVRALTEIRYRDFRIAIVRLGGTPDPLTYREALRISLAPSALLVLCNGFTSARGRLLMWLIVYPACAWMLTYPYLRCRLEVRDLTIH